MMRDMNISTWRMIVAAAALLCAGTGSFGGAVWTVSSWSARIDAHTTAIADHELRLRALELQTNQIATDVRWIREHLAQERER